jgi:hypothetical protein
MKKAPHKEPTAAERKKFYSSNVFKVLTIVIVLLVGWMTLDALRAYPLGHKLDYVGKVGVGSWMPLSSTPPYDVYYYGTDLNPEELADYFSGAKEINSLPANFESDGAFRITDHTGHGIRIAFYSKSSNLLSQNIHTTKKYIISVASFEYETVKNLIKD